MNLQKEELNITGMHCSGCVDRVTRVLQQIDGVQSANVSLDDKQAVVTFDRDQTGLNQMKEAIEKAGYHTKEQ